MVIYSTIKCYKEILGEVHQVQKFINIPHIGEILLEEFLEPLKISQNALALAINVPPNRINAIIRGQRSVTADTDLRLTKYFGLSKGYFLRLQNDFQMLETEQLIYNELFNIVPYDYGEQKKAI